jgi:hypothetical protein
MHDSHDLPPSFSTPQPRPCKESINRPALSLRCHAVILPITRYPDKRLSA